MSVKPLSGLHEHARPASLLAIEAGPARAIKTAICLCTYRRPEMLRRLLRHLREACRLPQGTELVVADNECSPDTAGIVREEFPEATYIAVPEVGLSEVRNAATDTALLLGADALAYIDDDDLPEPDWLEALIEHQARGNFPIVFGAVQERNDKTPRNCRGTCNCLVMRWALELIDPPYFDSRLNFIGGEDALLFERIEDEVKKAAHARASVVQKSLQDDRYSLVGLIGRSFSQGYRHVFVSRTIHPCKGRSAAAWCLRTWLKLLRALVLLPVKAWQPRAYRKVWEHLGAAAGTTFALLGGRYGYYRQPPAEKKPGI